ncbi:MAG: DUF4159 domain-containing protein [Flavobacteriaceae bacterium]|nr:DUF4159 domain-containing protein [Flavobacteriaceae bacterium]
MFFVYYFQLVTFFPFGQEVAVLKYEGGGDWYANPTAVPNLIKFSNENNKTSLAQKPKTVETDSEEIIFYPILFMTGHGNVIFNEKAVQNLRSYLVSGGFLHISDNYGLDASLRREMKKVFPELEFQEVPLDHPIYHQNYSFSQLPKIHEHDGKRAQGFGLFYNERLVCFYDYESDLSDGWEDQSIHNDPYELRLKALQMGANIISYAFLN